MIQKNSGHLEYLQSELLIEYGLSGHGWFNNSLGNVVFREGNPFNDPNWEDEATTLNRWGKGTQTLGFETNNLVRTAGLLQGADVLLVTHDQRGSKFGMADAYVTKELDTPIGLAAADCPLGILYDPDARILGMFHGGFIGSCVSEIALITLQRMQELGAKPSNVVCAIGPQLFPGHGYPTKEIDGISVENLSTHRFAERVGDSIDVQLTHRNALIFGGLRPERIDLIRLDTFTETQWASWARDNNDPAVRMYRNACIAGML